MADRPAAIVNQILDAIVDAIANHAAANPHLWARAPVSVKRYTGPSDTRAETPAIVVLTEGPIDDTLNLTLNLHRGECGIVIHCFDSDVIDPEAAAHDHAADIRRAVVADEQLGTVLRSGSLDPRGYEFGVESGETGSGAVEVILRFRANYEWSHDAT